MDSLPPGRRKGCIGLSGASVGMQGRPPGLSLPSVTVWDFKPPAPLGLGSLSGPAAAAVGLPALSLPSTPLPVPNCHQELAEGSTCQAVVVGGLAFLRPESER